jgi:hypothetical protein
MTQNLRGGRKVASIRSGLLLQRSGEAVLQYCLKPTLLTHYSALGFATHRICSLIQPHCPAPNPETLQAVPDFAHYKPFSLLPTLPARSVPISWHGVSYTSKCGIPLITVLLTILLDGTKAFAEHWHSHHYYRCDRWRPLLELSHVRRRLVSALAAVISATAQSALNVVATRHDENGRDG